MTILQIALLGVFPALMAYAAASDLLSMTISNRISLLLLVGFLALSFFAGASIEVIGQHLLAGLLLLAIGFALFCFGWIGGGDAKLMAATAIWLGWSNLVDYALISSALGGALTLLMLYARRFVLPHPLARLDWVERLHNPKNGVPYGIALAAGGLIVYPQIALWHAGFGG